MSIPTFRNETPVLPRIPDTLGTGTKTVTTAGVRVQLSTDETITCMYVIVCAKVTNTGYIFLGGSDVSSTSGIPLAALEKIRIDIDRLNKIYIDSSVSSEGVLYTYVT
jgi:hypothetical protein